MANLKKLFQSGREFFCISTLSLFIVIQPAYADSGSTGTQSTTDTLLTQLVNLTTQISSATYSMLIEISQVPIYIGTLSEMAASWIDTTDPSGTMANDQYAFSSLAANYALEYAQRLSTTTNLTQNFLLAGSFKPASPQLPSNANALAYTILSGQEIAPPITDALGIPLNLISPDIYAQNYIQNASGASLILNQPNPNWKASSAQAQYQSLYNTLAAIQSYSSYLVSDLYNQQAIDSATLSLETQASSSTWFQQIATESLGLVLRQMLMYSSQEYVQSLRLLKLQHEQLAAQAMTNVILIALAQGNIGQALAQQAAQSS